MTGTPSAIEWFLARNGRQHGPLSETEMRTFVDMGHLREQDLVWRSGFADWRAAPEVFAILKPMTPRTQAEPAQPPASQPVTQAAAAPSQQFDHKQPSQPERIAPRTQDAEANIQPSGIFAGGQTDQTRTAGRQPQSTQQPGLMSPQQLLRDDQFVFEAEARRNHNADLQPETPMAPASRSKADAYEPLARAQSQPARLQPSQTRQMQTVPTARMNDALASDASASAGRARYPTADGAAAKRGFGGAKIAATLVLMVLAGGVGTAILKRNELAAMWPAGLPTPTSLLSTVNSDSGVAAAPFASAGNNPDTIDGSFQRTPIWRHIKAEFPEWYADRVVETAKLSAEKRGDAVIAKHLAEAVVALRRKHADQALTASPDRLRFVASAFIDNLQSLAKIDVETCYGFISQGETYPAVLEMLQTQGANEPLQKQVIAVFEAISDGRKSPQSYLPPRKSDYDALAAELTSRGWTQADLQTFSDPRALGRATPQQVCKMVQDWFAAQISIKDPAAQLRLLVESLRPVVAG